MLSKLLGVVCTLSVALWSGGALSAEPEVDMESWLPKLKPGEDALVANRNILLNKMVERFDERVTIVKFDNDLETKCPTITSLFFSTGHRLKWLTPNSSLYDVNLYVNAGGADETSADVIVQNATCRYVLTVKRYEGREGDEKVVPVKNIPKIDGELFKPRPMKDRGDKGWFNEAVVPFADPSKPVNFTGIAFFSPATLTIYLANADKDLKISSESNFLAHSYTVEIKNPRAVLRISINKELYSNGHWTNAYAGSSSRE